MAADSSRSAVAPRAVVRRVLPLLAVLLLAANLRAPIAAVGPVLPEIGEDTGMAPWLLGVLSALPVAAFAACSPFGHRLASRIGIDRVLVVALLVLGAGTLLRSTPSDAWVDTAVLLVGTLVVGAAIAVGNVLLPVVVRRDFPAAVPRVTGYYIAVQSIVAGLASGLVVPVARATGSWRLALAVWGVVVLVALLVWAPRARAAGRDASKESTTADQEAAPVQPGEGERGDGSVDVWRSRLAWQVAAYFGCQSSAFYVLLTWLPTLEQDLGVGSVRAGIHLSVFLIAGIVANLVVPRLLQVGGDQRFATVLAPIGIVVAMLGIWVLPDLVPVWVAVAGLGTGGSMVLSLSLISLRSVSTTVAGKLSGMVQSSAYAGVVVALLLAGIIRDVAGPGTALVGFVLLIVAGQVVMAFRVGLDRRVDARG